MNLGRYLFIASLGVVLAGCGVSSEDDLRSWMQEQRNQMRPKVPQLAEPKPYVPENYNTSLGTEPFSKELLLSAWRKEAVPVASKTNALVAPELARRKQPLESFPLDSMAMVGSLIQDGLPAALLRVENQLYTVKTGGYLGMNFGRIVKISETTITIREIVQDGTGEWSERMATLQLQESTK